MITIQKPAIEDAWGIQEVFYKTWLATYPNEEFGITKNDIEERYKNRHSEEKTKKRIESIINVPENELFLVAKDESNVVGLCIVIKTEKFNQLQAIYILPEYQKKGIGTMLWNKAKEFLDDSKDTVIQVAEYNKQAILFYEKLGFVDTGKRFSEEKYKMPISGSVIPEMEMIFKK